MAGIVGIGSWRVARGLFLAACLIATCSPSLRGDDAPSKAVFREPSIPESMSGPLKELNRDLGYGVLPESNAVVDLLTLYNQNVDAECRADFFQLLGLESVPSGQPVLMSCRLEISRPGWDRFHYAINPTITAYNGGGFRKKSAVWSAKDHPEFFQYLEQNRSALDRFAAAAKKEAYYCPVVKRTQHFRGAFVTTVRLLLDRSMNRLDSGDLQGALDDVLASRRFCALMARSPIDLDDMNSIAGFELRAFMAESELVSTNKLSAAQLKPYIQGLLKLPSPATHAQVWKTSLLRFDAEIDEAIRQAKTQFVGTPLDFLPVFSHLGIEVSRWPSDTDWVIVRKQMKEMLSAYGKVMETPPRSARDWEHQFEALRREHQVLAQANSVPGSVEHRGRAAGAQLFLELFLHNRFRHDWGIALMKTSRAVSIAGLAALAYRLERGKYPSSLAALKPDYLKEIPLDAHTGGPLVYRQLYGNAPPIVFGKGANWTDDDFLNYGDDIPLWLP